MRERTIRAISLNTQDKTNITIQEYQELSTRTLNKNLSQEQLLSNMCLGLAGESGEVVDLVKKHLYQGHELDASKLKEELGDVMFYLANLCNAAEIELSEVLQGNIDKLRERYPEGFEIERSVNR